MIENISTPGVEGRAGKFPGPSLIPALYAIQERCGWLPREELVTLSQDVKRPLYEIEGLISYYPHFRTDPPTKVDLHVCRDLSCWLRGSEDRIAAIRERYGDDIEVEVEEVSCLGRCDNAPAVAVNDVPAHVDRTDELVEAARTETIPQAEVAVYSPDGPWPNDPYAPGEERYRSLRKLVKGEITAEQVIETLSESGLRGLGGAGFPTGKKWEITAAQPGPVKYAICNADESEPGTFKDRQTLAEQPHLVLEGMLLSMVVIGAEEGWVFIRHEYGPEELVLRAEIDKLREEGLLGEDVLGTGTRLQVDVFVSPGGYILGEETALLECMEGHRGEPRNKPPFPGVYGLHGKPTVMNSVETYADVPVIIERGAQWWQDQGIGDAVGLKFFAVSGHVAKPGLYNVPLGTTARELLDMAGGMLDGAKLGAWQPGGASSNFLGEEKLDTPLDFAPLAEAGSMIGSGALVVVNEETDLLAAGTNVLRFFRDESCGKCVPCRVGSGKAHTLLLDTLSEGGELDEHRQEQLRALEAVMRKTSICGLGQVAMGPVVSVFGLERGGAMARTHPR